MITEVKVGDHYLRKNGKDIHDVLTVIQVGVESIRFHNGSALVFDPSKPKELSFSVGYDKFIFIHQSVDGVKEQVDNILDTTLENLRTIIANTVPVYVGDRLIAETCSSPYEYRDVFVQSINLESRKLVTSDGAELPLDDIALGKLCKGHIPYGGYYTDNYRLANYEEKLKCKEEDTREVKPDIKTASNYR